MTTAQNKTVSNLFKRPVPTPLLWWLTSGTVVTVLYTITYFIEGAIRPDYNPIRNTISTLSLGPGGWVQQVNFIVFGAITVWTAFAWRRFLKGGVGEIWYPIMRGIQGFSLIMLGLFNADPNEGYPKDAVFITQSFNGLVHNIFGGISFIGIIVGFFILARRFTREPNWRGWTTYSMITAILTWVLFSVFIQFNKYNNDFTGLFQRLTVSLDYIWGIVFFTRLWMGAGFGVFQKKDSVPA